KPARKVGRARVTDAHGSGWLTLRCHAGLEKLETGFFFLAVDYALDVAEQLPRIEDDAVLDSVFHAAHADNVVVLVELDRPGAIQALQVLERIGGDDGEVGELAGLDAADLLVQAQGRCAIECSRPDDLRRMEARLPQQRQFADIGEAVKLEDEARIRAGRDATATV